MYVFLIVVSTYYLADLEQRGLEIAYNEVVHLKKETSNGCPKQ